MVIYNVPALGTYRSLTFIPFRVSLYVYVHMKHWYNTINIIIMSRYSAVHLV